MAKKTFSSDFDQNDPKIFRESLGSFGTTTKPGGNQLHELQVKIRQGVKHVELHLSGTGKGQFGVQDVPDKYGFEQRRTIMQLAKLNNQNLSVHGTFDVFSFSGLEEGGINEAHRYNNIKEIDETIKFAAETATKGAVVFHIQGDGLSTDRSELNISKSYINWLQEKAKTDEKYKKEWENLKKNYFTENNLEREFVNNPEEIKEIKENFQRFIQKNKSEYQKIKEQAKAENKEEWEVFYLNKQREKLRLSPDRNPMIVVGDRISKTERSEELVNFDVLKKANKYLGKDEITKLEKLGIHVGEDIDLNSYMKLKAIFSNDKTTIPEELDNKTFEKIKKKLIFNYNDALKNNYFLQAQADSEFHKKLIENKLFEYNLQEEELRLKYELHKDNLERLKKLEEDRREELRNLKKLPKDDLTLHDTSKEIIKQNLSKINREIEELKQYTIGLSEYQQLSQFDEAIAEINAKKKQLADQKDDIKAVTDISFDKNASTLGHLGIKALKYQLDMKKKAKVAKEKLKEIRTKVEDLRKSLETVEDNNQRNKILNEIDKIRYEEKKWVGVSDYEIDLEKNPLYLAPENMLPGMGSLTSLEEYKAVIRMGQEEFANKILSEESKDYKILREEYERETGIKIKTKEDALKLAKKHLAGTFDNAHAGVWLKHFKPIDGESEEERLDRFNKWLNDQAVEMYKEGLIKHVHFNDTQAKQDDHNLLGQGILDIHDLRERLRAEGFDEALIVEAGGRGAPSNMHISNALDIFNPTLVDTNRYGVVNTDVSSGVSDWVSVTRNYTQRIEYSQYGMGYSTFKHQPPGQGKEKGEWSGTSFF